MAIFYTKTYTVQQAHFIVGFNSWGKTTTIHQLMDRDPERRVKYLRDRTYRIPTLQRDQSFVIQSQSNDDIDLALTDAIRERLRLTEAEVPNLIAALCPARERRNSMATVFQDPIFDRFERFHFHLLEYKWDAQAKLMLEAVESYIGELNRPSTCYRILGFNLTARIAQIKEQFEEIYR